MKNKPVHIEGFIFDWPALTKWNENGYFSEYAGLSETNLSFIISNDNTYDL